MVEEVEEEEEEDSVLLNLELMLQKEERASALEEQLA